MKIFSRYILLFTVLLPVVSVFNVLAEEKAAGVQSETNELRIPEAISILGEYLYADQIPFNLMGAPQWNLQETMQAFSIERKTTESYIKLGRSLAFVCRYNEAVDVFTDGIDHFPAEAMLYRYRGHRFITMRKFSMAIADLIKASELKKDDFDILFHLGLAYYLDGKYSDASDTYKKCMKYANDDEGRISTSFWWYLTCLKTNDSAGGARILKRVKHGLKVIENKPYYDLLFFFKGERKADDIMASVEKTLIDIYTCGYGVAEWYISKGDKQKGIELFTMLLKHKPKFWVTFGCIATEVEISKLIKNGQIPASNLKDLLNLDPKEYKISIAMKKWIRMWNNYDLDIMDDLFLKSDTLSYFSSTEKGIIRGFDAVKKHLEKLGFVRGGKDSLDRFWLDQPVVSIVGNTAIITGMWYLNESSLSYEWFTKSIKDMNTLPIVPPSAFTTEKPCETPCFFCPSETLAEKKKPASLLKKGPFTFVFSLEENTPRLIHLHFTQYPDLKDQQ